jgi:hypothetical protein
VSLLSRNRSQDRVNGVRGHAMRMAQQAAPLANQAVPMAKNAGTTIRTGATGAVEWATPKVNDLRAWAAPQLEQAGLAVKGTIAPKISEAVTGTIAPKISDVVTDTIAPRISDALVSTAHKVDVIEYRPHRRRWPLVLAGTLLLAAAASAAAAISRRRLDLNGYQPSSEPVDDAPAATLTDIAEHRDGDGSNPADSEVDGNFRS